MRRHRLFAGFGVGVLPLHHGQQLGLGHARRTAVLAQVAHPVAEIPPGGVRVRRSVLGGIGQRGVGVGAVKVADGQPVEPLPRHFGVVVGLRLGRTAERRGLGVLAVQRPAARVPRWQRVDLDFLVLRRPGGPAAQVAPFALVGFHVFPFLVKKTMGATQGTTPGGPVRRQGWQRGRGPPSFSPVPLSPAGHRRSFITLYKPI